MRFSSWILSSFTSLASIILTTGAAPHGIGAKGKGVSVHFTSTIFKDTSVRYIMDSGICETTPGVTQYSGYITVGNNMSMWFWFFEARHSPETAPFTLWLNGGPGCSSMIGLFQENGPCQVNPDGMTTSLNPYSWNNVSNMIYIDQPIGSGFSYGTDSANTTWAAAPFVWKAFQVLFESQIFTPYARREFIFATESYGGHYGPAFVTYFNDQNAKIASGAISGELLFVSALLMNNFARNAPGYGQLVSNEVLANISHGLWNNGGCIDQLETCYAAENSASSDTVCLNADNYCTEYVILPAIGDRDPYDLRQNSSALFPPDYYVTYLNRQDIMNQIGAEVQYQQCSTAASTLMVDTGDVSSIQELRARTLLPQLSELAESGLRILMWVSGCNWVGGYETALAMDWPGKSRLNKASLTNITIQGEAFASVANVDNFSFARVFKAGHEIPAFQPAAALEIFSQIIHGEQLHSV
ncbi:hypothetical protein ID866_9862 [Astraeus odoratus]|nr:hypothetical protein ID866_9862 [Astraeus odoratus]